MLAPGIVDIVENAAAPHRWQPGDRRTRLLVLGAEACRDILHQAVRYADPGARARVVKSLATPVCNLMDVVDRLLGTLKDGPSRRARDAWPDRDQTTYRTIARRMRNQHQRGPVRRTRNKLDAHLDDEVFGDQTLRLREDDLLGAMGDGLVLLMLALNHPASSFSWIRHLGSTADGKHERVETMFDYPGCVCWTTDSNGRVVGVGPVRLAADPRHEVQGAVVNATETYNQMAALAGTRIAKIHITMMNSSDDVQESGGFTIART